MPAKQKESESFEKNMVELEGVVRKLEAGDVSLEEMLALFERGVALTKSSTKLLDTAEQKIKILMKNKDGEVEEKDFDQM